MLYEVMCSTINPLEQLYNYNTLGNTGGSEEIEYLWQGKSGFYQCGQSFASGSCNMVLVSMCIVAVCWVHLQSQSTKI